MRWLKRILWLVVSLSVLGVVIVLAGVFFSLDWDRRYSAETRILPLLEDVGRLRSTELVQIEANGFTFRARAAGLNNDGPGLILLHGFPETSAMWDRMIDAADAAGFRVIAFDQRGYSPGARPDGIENYVLPELMEDVIAIADALGFDRFHLVGHDWGCIVGWGTTIQYPQRVLSWTGLSIPHPGTLVSRLREELPVYIQIFTAPFVPEAMLSWNDLANLRESAYANATPEQRDEYLALFSEPGALTAALNWYRAITSNLEGAESAAGPVEGVSTLFIWGTREAWVSEDALVLQRKLVNAPYSELEVDADHFVMQDKPDEVVAAVLAHIDSLARTPPP